MYYSRRRPLEDFPKEMTAIWSCTREDCKGWMRNNYSFEDVPACPQCKSPMISSMKNLPILLDSTYEVKTVLKTMNEKQNVPAQ